MWIFMTGFRLFMIPFSVELSPTGHPKSVETFTHDVKVKEQDNGDVRRVQGRAANQLILRCQCGTSPLTGNAGVCSALTGSLKLEEGQRCLQVMLQRSAETCTQPR